MKVVALRELNDEDLAKKEENLREELGRMKFKHGLRPLEDSSTIKKLRKNIARTQTVIRERRTEQ